MSLLRLDVWEQIVVSNPVVLQPCATMQLLGAGGEPLTVHGWAQVSLKLGSNCFLINKVVVSSLTSQAILGLDFLVDQQATISLTNRTLQLKEGGCDIPLEAPPIAGDDPIAKCYICSASTDEIPPRSSMQIQGTVSGADRGLWLLEETPKRLPVAVAWGLVEVTSTSIPVIVLNPLEEPVTLYRAMELATLQEVDEPTACEVGSVEGGQTTAVEQHKQEMLWDLVEKSPPDLSQNEKDLFYHLLLSYAYVIAYSAADLGRTSVLTHNIPTGNAAPIRQSVRRISPRQRQNVQQMLTQMLNGGIVEPSTGPWASPIVLVQKKDGSTRFCVDYRKLNNITQKDAYPLP